jgi:hypothetical protein
LAQRFLARRFLARRLLARRLLALSGSRMVSRVATVAFEGIETVPVDVQVQIMPGGGFSGNVIDVYHYARSITPSDAMTFFTGGTAGTTYTSNTLPSKTPFGYSVSVGVTDNTGNVVKQVTF